MITLDEMKQWLRMDIDDDDELILNLIQTSESPIEIATGVTKEFVSNCEDKTLNNLYKMAQRIIVTDLYNEKSIENKALTSFYIQIEARYINLCQN